MTAYRLGSTLLLAFALTTPAHALDMSISGGTETQTIDLDSGPVSTTFTTLEYRISGQLNDWLSAGGHSGIVSTQSNNSSQYGQFYGGSLRASFPIQEKLSGSVGLRYTQYSTEGDSSGQTVSSEWGESVVGTGIHYQLKPLTLSSTLDYSSRSGEQTVESGGTSISDDIIGPNGFTFGVNARLPLGSGAISVYWQTGVNEGYGFAFQQSLNL